MDENREVIRRKIDEWFSKNTDNMIRDLARLIAVRSVRSESQPGAPFGKESREVLSTAQTIFQEHGFESEVFEDIIVTVTVGEKQPRLGILAHLDVVPAGEGWDTDPFELTVHDGYIHGRGASDDKGPAVAAMYAMYAACEISGGAIDGFQLLLGSGEETGCTDIEQYLSKRKTPDYVFTPDAGFPVYNIEKGRFLPTLKASWDADLALPRVKTITGGSVANIVPNRAEAVLEGITLADVKRFCKVYSVKTGAKLSALQDGAFVKVVCEGTASHAASPEFGVNAQTALLEMLVDMPFAESTGFNYIRALKKLLPHGDTRGQALGIQMSDSLTGELTVNFGVLQLTETGFTGNFDSRTPECADKTDIAELTRAAFDRENIEITDVSITKCHHTPGDGEFVDTLLRAYKEYTGEDGECLSMGGTTYVHDIPGGVAFGCGMAGQDDRIHGANERIGVEQLIISAKMFTQVILDLCNG